MMRRDPGEAVYSLALGLACEGAETDEAVRQILRSGISRAELEEALIVSAQTITTDDDANRKRARVFVEAALREAPSD